MKHKGKIEPKRNDLTALVINIDELAMILGITKKTIYNRLSANDDMPPPRKFGKKLLWLRNEVEQWVMDLPIAA